MTGGPWQGRHEKRGIQRGIQVSPMEVSDWMSLARQTRERGIQVSPTEVSDWRSLARET